MILLALLLACNGDKDDTGSQCYNLTDQTDCAAYRIEIPACCTGEDVCIVGARTYDGEKLGYDVICYDGIESEGCVNAIAGLESLWCIDSGQ